MTDTPRATRRPDHVRAPDHWVKGPPPPEPRAVTEADANAPENPTRYGDWVLKGIAVDF